MDLSDIFQHFRIADAQKNATRAKHTGESQQVSIDQLQDQLDHLSLVCAAMCELMEEIGFDKAMLAKKIEEIDLRDGKLDGKHTKSIECSSCNRTVASRHVKCLYCGSKIERG